MWKDVSGLSANHPKWSWVCDACSACRSLVEARIVESDVLFEGGQFNLKVQASICLPNALSRPHRCESLLCLCG